MSMSDNEKRNPDTTVGSMDERQMSAIVRGVFWFTWLTAKYRRAALAAARIEKQKAELN